MTMWRLALIVAGSIFLSGCGQKNQPSESTQSQKGSQAPSDSATEKGEHAGKAKNNAEEKHDREANESEEAGEGTGGPLQISAAAQRRIGLSVVSASVTPLAEVLTLTGTVEALESRIATVRSLANGRVTDVLVKVGDRVTRGQSLARFDNIEAGDIGSQYNTAQAELARLRIQQAVTARQAERSRKLAEIGAIPQKELEAIEAERQGQQEAIRAQESTIAGLSARLRRFGVSDPGATVSTTTIQAPFGGVVTAVNTAPGAVVDTALQLFSIADLSRVYVAGQVYEKDLGRVRIGQVATVLVPSFADVRFTGRVASISSALDPQTRTASVRVEVPNSGERLRMEMFATVELPTTANREALTVPSDAIQRVEGKPVVFVRQDETHFAVRPVQLGRMISNLAEVTAGLKAGESVVAKGSFHLKSTLLGKELAEEE